MSVASSQPERRSAFSVQRRASHRGHGGHRGSFLGEDLRRKPLVQQKWCRTEAPSRYALTPTRRHVPLTPIRSPPADTFPSLPAPAPILNSGNSGNS